MGKPANASAPHSSVSAPLPRPRRKPGQRITLKEEVEIAARIGADMPKTHIAREMGCSIDTVTKVLNSEQLSSLREYGRSKIGEMIPKAVKVIDYRLNRNSETAAALVLKGAGVLAPDQQVNVGVFAQGASVDIQGLIGLADDSPANCAPIASESAAEQAPAERVLPDNEDTKPAK